MLRSTRFLVSGEDAIKNAQMTEMERLEEQARIEGQVKASRYRQKNARKAKKKETDGTERTETTAQTPLEGGERPRPINTALFGARKLVQVQGNKSHKRRSRKPISQNQRSLQTTLRVKQIQKEKGTVASSPASVDLVKEGVVSVGTARSGDTGRKDAA